MCEANSRKFVQVKWQSCEHWQWKCYSPFAELFWDSFITQNPNLPRLCRFCDFFVFRKNSYFLLFVCISFMILWISSSVTLSSVCLPKSRIWFSLIAYGNSCP